jgi:16S rRNA (adenine1518-N6/adenine1519-N6)-dimethyltransferase
MPVPNVDSVIVSFSKKDYVMPLEDKELFYKIVRDSFQFKRKTIRNNLKKYDLNIIEKVLEDNGFSLSSRAEQLPVSVFVDMSNCLSKK